MMRSIAALALLPLITLFVTGCGSGGGEANPEALTGKVTFNGQPVKNVTITATGANGSVYGGTTNDEGVYTIPSPAKGRMEFVLISAGRPTFPDKYTKPKNGLAVEYVGGKQKYDMDLQP